MSSSYAAARASEASSKHASASTRASGSAIDGAPFAPDSDGSSRQWHVPGAKHGAKHVTWDEAAIAEHRACAGVLYGTQRIEERLTPFLYYSESVSRGEGTMGELVPGQGVSTVSIAALQERLGVLAFAQGAGGELRPSAAAQPDRPLPPAPWLLLQSRSEPGESFYFNPTTSEATWTLPAAPADATAEAEGARSTLSAEKDGDDGASTAPAEEAALVSSDDADDEEVPVPSSRLAAAADCAAEFAHRRRHTASAAASR